jgi:phosphoglycerate kinase
MKKLKDFDFHTKNVLLRANFDVPVNDKGEIADDFRIRKSLPTIKYLLADGAALILLSHLGRPSEGKTLSLAPVAKKLEELLDTKVIFVKDCLGRVARNITNKMRPGQVVLLENLRFYSEEGANNEVFAKQLASFGEIYVNDAFSNCHRPHASIVGIPKYLPKAAGLLLEEEIKVLSSALKEPRRPLVVVLGGAKVASKLPCLLNFLDLADHVVVGGLIAPAILAAKRISISVIPLEEEVEEKLAKLELTNSKLHLPVDALVGLKSHQEDYLRQSAVGKIRSEEQMFDIGPETVRIFSDIILEAKTVIWNGPLGYIEDKRFSGGSLAIASAILRSPAFSIVGGGDTDAFLADNNLRGKFSYVSTGGGAMLEFLSGKELPGIKALED